MMKKHEMARIAIEEKLKTVQWNSMTALRGLFIDRRVYPRVQTVSDSTIRRVLRQMQEEGLIDSKWRCIYPRFFLTYFWIGDDK